MERIEVMEKIGKQYFIEMFGEESLSKHTGSFKGYAKKFVIDNLGIKVVHLKDGRVVNHDSIEFVADESVLDHLLIEMTMLYEDSFPVPVCGNKISKPYIDKNCPCVLSGEPFSHDGFPLDWVKDMAKKYKVRGTYYFSCGNSLFTSLYFADGELFSSKTYYI